jgi:hypothetical protein
MRRFDDFVCDSGSLREYSFKISGCFPRQRHAARQIHFVDAHAAIDDIDTREFLSPLYISLHARHEAAPHAYARAMSPIPNTSTQRPAPQRTAPNIISLPPSSAIQCIFVSRQPPTRAVQEFSSGRAQARYLTSGWAPYPHHFSTSARRRFTIQLPSGPLKRRYGFFRHCFRARSHATLSQHRALAHEIACSRRRTHLPPTPSSPVDAD